MVKKKESLHIHGEKKAMCLKKHPHSRKTLEILYFSLFASPIPNSFLQHLQTQADHVALDKNLLLILQYLSIFVTSCFEITICSQEVAKIKQTSFFQ